MRNIVVNNFEVYAGSVRREMLVFVPKQAKKILDVGCSVGNFGALLKDEREAEVWGIEVDDQAAEIANSKLDHVICSSFGDNPQLKDQKFDCIVFNDVLEHMIDPYSALSYAKDLLAPRGCVVASIPNVRFFDNLWNLVIKGSWEYTDDGLLDRTHLRFFTKSSIRTMFEDRGYKIETMEGLNPVDWFDPKRRQWFRYLNFLSFNRLEDARWLQFAVVAFPS